MVLAIGIVGWVGAALILLAYALVSAGRVGGASTAYQWINIAGSAGLAVNSAWNGAMPSVALNVIWLGIGVAALLRRRPPPASAAS